jgi:hypothetical protein
VSLICSFTVPKQFNCLQLKAGTVTNDKMVNSGCQGSWCSFCPPHAVPLILRPVLHLLSETPYHHRADFADQLVVLELLNPSFANDKLRHLQDEHRNLDNRYPR